MENLGKETEKTSTDSCGQLACSVATAVLVLIELDAAPRMLAQVAVNTANQ